MATQTAGEIAIWAPEILKLPLHDPIIITKQVDLYNFDIDVADPKPEHKKFLTEKILPILRHTPGSAVFLLGSASRSGESKYNYGLSADRAKAVETLLHPSRFHTMIPAGVGKPTFPGPKEDKHDRAVRMFLTFEIKVADLSFYTDDWLRKLESTDVIGMDADDLRPLRKINMQLTMFGAPRELTDGGVNGSTVMPYIFPLEAVSTRDGWPSSGNHFDLKMAEDRFQTQGDFSTVYRLSDSAVGMGFLPNPVSTTVAAVVKEGRSDLTDGTALDSRGRSAQTLIADRVSPGSLDTEAPPALSILKSGGIEVISIRAKKCSPVFLFLRSFATVFYYAGDGSNMGSLTLRLKPWAEPQDLRRRWQKATGMEALILVAPDVLRMGVTSGITTAALPGSRWTGLLRSKGGPFTAILGYRGDAPDLGSIAKGIATKMGRKIAAGLSGDDWVQAWLQINANDPGGNTWNAVGMDKNGYWWIDGVNRVAAGAHQLVPKWDWVTPNPGHLVNLIPGPVKQAYRAATGPAYQIAGPAVIP